MPELPLEKKRPPLYQDFKRLVAESRLEEALQQLMAFTESQGLTEWYNRLVVQSAKWEQYARHQSAGVVSYDDLTRTHATISLALLDIINDLPQEEPLSPGKKKLQGIREGRLKFQIFWVLLLGKMAFFVYLLTDLQSGTIPFKGFLLITGVVLPTFAAHLTAILQERLAGRYTHSASNEKRINRGVQCGTYLILFLYLGSIFFVLETYYRGGIPRETTTNEAGVAIPDFQNLLLLLALIESSLGVYIGSIIHTLFKAKEG